MGDRDRWIWLAGSLLLAVGASQIAGWAKRQEKSPAWLDRLEHSPLAPFLVQVVRFLYYVGFPFAALIWGHAVVGRFFGLQPLITPDLAANRADWAMDVGWAVALGTTTWILLAIGWWSVRRVRGVPDLAATEVSIWIPLREAIFHEVHWAFYRNAPILFLREAWGATSGEYWGVWLGAGLVILEAVLNPGWRENLRDARYAPATLVRAGLLALSAVLYLKTMNLWLAILVHWCITWGLTAWAHRLGRISKPPQSVVGDAL